MDHTFATAGFDGAFNFWDKDSKQRLKVPSLFNTLILTCFILENLVFLCIKIMNSIVVVGLYYRFMTTFSIGTVRCVGYVHDMSWL